MKHLEFRIWDHKLKKFTYQKSIFGQRPYTELNSGVAFQIDGSTPRYHKITICQYTSFKDMLDKKIFEGDILLYLPLGSNNPKKYVPKFIDGKFCFERHDTFYEQESFGNPCSGKLRLKIIGNIFENETLLP